MQEKLEERATIEKTAPSGLGIEKRCLNTQHSASKNKAKNERNYWMLLQPAQILQEPNVGNFGE